MEAPASPAAVLFDMDGTLLDSEPLWDRALHDLAAAHGGRLTDAVRAAMLGRPTAESLAIFYDALAPAVPDPAADRAFLTDRMAALFGTELRWRPGAAELVAEVRHAEVPTALVTSTERPLVEAALASTLGADTFDTVVSGSDVTRAKPDPESYLTAATRLGVPIGRCVAIEDSPTGLASACAAGAVVVGVAGQVPLSGRDGAHLVDTMAAVDLTCLRRLVARATGAASGRPGGPVA